MGYLPFVDFRKDRKLKLIEKICIEHRKNKYPSENSYKLDLLELYRYYITDDEDYLLYPERWVMAYQALYKVKGKRLKFEDNFKFWCQEIFCTEDKECGIFNFSEMFKHVWCLFSCKYKTWHAIVVL